ncbi:MAG: MFS transporter [Limosilactobacillus sp.]|uniref:MDR family MFS transporter n=1 Tax=Limosilactobacillus sp. TaxID=2773925 RepID=UPI0027065182|nr:MFS transporter [Limosilactobacillus sp.]
MTTQKQVKLKWVALASLLNNTGAAFLWPLTTMYVHNYLHETLTTAGVVMLFISICMMAGNYAGGWMFDHWDQYKTAVVGVVISTCAIVALIFQHSWPWFALLMMMNSFGDGINMTVINSYGSLVKHFSSRYVFNYIYMAFNIGVVIGTLAVGVLLPISVVLVFAVGSIFYGLLTLVVIFTLNVRVPVTERKAAVKQARGAGSHRKIIAFIWLILINYVTVHLSYSLWESVMAVHMTSQGIPFYAYSLLWTLNGILIIIGQPLINKLSPYVKLSTQIMIGLLIFASSFLLLIFANTIWAFAIDFTVLTIGEMASFAGLPAWIAQLTTADETGHYQGMLNITMSIGRAIGPLYGGFVIDQGNYNDLFISVFVLMTVTLAIVTIYMNRLKKTKVLSK